MQAFTRLLFSALPFTFLLTLIIPPSWPAQLNAFGELVDYDDCGPPGSQVIEVHGIVKEFCRHQLGLIRILISIFLFLATLIIPRL